MTEQPPLPNLPQPPDPPPDKEPGTDGVLRRPEPSWRVLDADDLLSRSIVASNQLHIQIARACTPAMTDVIDDVLSRLAVRLGLTEYKASRYVEIGFMLQNYPQLAAFLEQGQFSYDHLNRLADALACVPEDKRVAVEVDLLAKLQPRRPNQMVPTPSKVRRHAQSVIERLHPPARPKDDTPLPPPPPGTEDQQPELSWNASKDEVTDFYLKLNMADSAELIQVLEYVSAHENCSRGEALLMLIHGQTTAEVTLNIYRPVNQGEQAQPEGSVWAYGQWLAPMVGQQWMDRVTHIAAPGFERCAGYKPTASIRAAVMGRDGHCRFPGCAVPAQRCDLDHVHRWDHDDRNEDGSQRPGVSETSTANLHCLCRKHHRLKTAEQWDVALHADGSETWTSFGDGHVVTTLPGGVLGRVTFEHAAVRRVKNLALYNDERVERLRWQLVVCQAARVAEVFGAGVDETASARVVEAFAQMGADARAAKDLEDEVVANQLWQQRLAEADADAQAA